jgi:hypothetical protein
MALRTIMALRRMPAPPEKAPTVREVVDQASRMPGLLPVRLFWDSMQELRSWWPLLLPLLLVTAYRAYRAERRRLIAQQQILPPASDT